MDHSYFHSRLSALADGELSADERAQVEEHVKQCQDCRQRLDQLRQLEELTERESSLADSDYWETAAQRIEANLEASVTPVTDITEPRAKAKSSFWWKLPAIAASILVVGYVGLHESDILQDDIMVPPSDQSPTESRAIEEPEADTSEKAAAVTPEQTDAGLTTPVEDHEVETDATELNEVMSPPSTDREDVPTALGDDYRPHIVTEERSGRPTPEPESESRRNTYVPAVPAEVAPPEPTVESESLPLRSKTKTQVSVSSGGQRDVLDRYNTPAKKADDNLESKEPVATKLEAAPTPPPPPVPAPPAPPAPAQSNYKTNRVGFDGFQGIASLAAPDEVFVLNDLRRQRDSLTALIAELEVDPASLKGLTDTAHGLVTYMDDNRRRKSGASVDRTTLTQARIDLVGVWCRICLDSEDENEVAQGVDFLRKVEDERLAGREEAATCLDAIERQ